MFTVFQVLATNSKCNHYQLYVAQGLLVYTMNCSGYFVAVCLHFYSFVLLGGVQDSHELL